VAICPIRRDDGIFGPDPGLPISGVGTVEIIGKNVNQVSVGDVVYYSASIYSYIESLGLIITEVSNILVKKDNNNG
jgi:hypothetical protein